MAGSFQVGKMMYPHINTTLLVAFLDAEIKKLEGDKTDVSHFKRMALLEQKSALELRPNVHMLEHRGGAWLAKAREWVQLKYTNGSDVHWGTNEVLEGGTVTVADIEDFAARIAEAAIASHMGEYVKGAAGAVRKGGTSRG
jgi:hypothetical protein